MAISTNGTIITRLAGALYGEYLSNASYVEVSTTAPATVAANWLSNDFAGKTDAQIATTILTNLGLTSIAGLDNYVAGQLTAAGSTAAAKGASLVSMLNGYANMTADATYGGYATTFNTKVASALTISQTTGAAAGTWASVSSANPALTLTSATQTSTGTAGDDTFTAAAGTWGAGDVVNGGAGTDTLNATITGTAPTQSATSLVGVEVLNLTASPNPSTLDLTGVTGLTQVNNVSSANGATLAVSGLGNVVNTSITGGNTSTTVSYATSAVAGTADAATVSLKGTAAGSTFTTSGVETLTINSGTAANTLTSLSSSGMTKLVVTGDQALTIGGTAGNSGTGATATYDLSAATGALTLTTGNGTGTSSAGVTVTGPSAATAGALTLTTGSNNDSVTLGAGANTVSTAAGNDTITSGGGANTITPGAGNDTVNLGAGVDTVRFAEVGATNADTLNTFGSTDVIAVNIGAAAVTGANAANASASAAFGVVPTGATSPVLQNVGGTATANAVTFKAIAPNATATVGTVAATSNVISLNGAYTDGTAAGVVTALGTSATTGITTTSAGKFLLVTYSVGNIAQVWSYAGDSTSNTDIDAAELSLVATLNGVALGGLTAANFSTYLTPVTTSTTVSNAGQIINLTGILNTVQSTANTAGQYLTAAADTINVGVGTAPTGAASATTGLTVLDPAAGDADVMNISVLGDWAAGSVISNIETLNLTMLVAGTTFNAAAKTPGTTTFNALGTQNLTLTGAVSGTAFGLGAGYTGTFDITPVANPTAAYTLNLNGTSGTSAATSPTFAVTGNNVITALTINANAATTLNMDTNTTESATSTLNGAGNVTIFDTAANFAAANIVATEPAYTGVLTFRPSTSAAMDFTATGVVSGLDTIDYSDLAADAVDSHTITVPAATTGGNSISITDSPTTARDSSIQNFTLVQAGSSLADTATFTFGARTTPAITGAITAASTETVTINYTPTTAGTAFSVANITTASALGAQTVNINGTGAFTLGTVTADTLNTTGVGSTGSVSATLANGSAGAIFTGGAGAATIIGSTSADIFTGGAGADTFRTTVTGAGATAADRMTGGAGSDTFILSGDTAQASTAAATAYALAPNITDFSISGSNGTDVIQLSATAGNYAGASALFAGVAAAAAGSTGIQSVAASNGAAAIVAGTDLIKLTTATAVTGTLQALFNAAIGTSTVTGLTANDDIVVSLYDSTNSKMVLVLVNAAATTTTIVETGDVVTLVGTVDMTAAQYASFGVANLSVIGA